MLKTSFTVNLSSIEDPKSYLVYDVLKLYYQGGL